MSDKLIHAVKMADGALMVSAQLMKQLKESTELATTSIGNIAGIEILVSPHLPYKEKIWSAHDWFSRNGGIKNKSTRELVMLLDSKKLSGSGYGFKILKRGRIILTELPYAKDFRRTVRHSKEIQRKRNG